MCKAHGRRYRALRIPRPVSEKSGVGAAERASVMRFVNDEFHLRQSTRRDKPRGRPPALSGSQAFNVSSCFFVLQLVPMPVICGA
jgi:hypothetical protein